MMSTSASAAQLRRKTATATKKGVPTTNDERSAFEMALSLHCQDSETETSDESSAESDSDIDERLAGRSIRLISSLPQDTGDDEMEESAEMAMNAIRIPQSFSRDLSFVMDQQRKVSSTSQRGPQSLGITFPDDFDKDHNKNKDRPRPAPISFDGLPSTTPRIEIEQIFDEVALDDEYSSNSEDEKQTNLKRQSLDLEGSNVTAASKRSAARTRMMQALGRDRKAILRRSESMDEVVPTSPSSTSSSTLKPAESASSALPRTPGTAFHPRSASCPTPNSPQLHQFGDFSVVVTPPTPRPQGSPIIGVFIRGVHKAPPTTRYCPCSFGFNPLLPQEYGGPTNGSNGAACIQCREEARLKVPHFEMAPGKIMMMQQQRQQALALIAWQRSQQQMMNVEWCKRVKQEEMQLADDEPSIRHVGSSRRDSKPTTSSGSDSRSWRRAAEPSSAPMSWTGSSASMYSQESASSAADSAISWRRKSKDAGEGGSSPHSAPAQRLQQSTSQKYIPPAKRAGGCMSDALKGRKEGSAARATVASTKSTVTSVPRSTKNDTSSERERAAQTMLARLHSRNGSSINLSA